MVVRSGYIAGKNGAGPQVERLERALEEYYDAPHALVFNSATSALHAALFAVGVKPHKADEPKPRVLVSPFTMSASAAAIIHAGAIPMFCDINRNNYCMDWETPNTRRAERTGFRSWKAAVLVHLFGYHADYPRHSAWPIVHDAAQAPSLMPVPHRGQDVWVYSLNQHKIIQCGEGGYALCYRRELADKMHAIRNHGEAHIHSESCRGKPPQYHDCWSGHTLGWNYRMTEMQAEIAYNELQELDSRLAIRRIIGAKYWPDSKNRDWYIAPACGVQVPNVQARKGYVPPVYKLEYFVKNRIRRGTPCPIAEEIAENFVYYMGSDLVEAHADIRSNPVIQQSRPARPVPRHHFPTNSAAR